MKIINVRKESRETSMVTRMEGLATFRNLFRDKISRPCTFGDFDLREVKGQAVTSTLQKYSKRKSSQSAFMGGGGVLLGC
jgi:hypothetical protein